MTIIYQKKREKKGLCQFVMMPIGSEEWKPNIWRENGNQTFGEKMETKHLERKRSYVPSMCLTKCFDHCSQDQSKRSFLSPSPNAAFLFVGRLTRFINNSWVLFKYCTTRLKTNSPTNPTCPVRVQYTKQHLSYAGLLFFRHPFLKTEQS